MNQLAETSRHGLWSFRQHPVRRRLKPVRVRFRPVPFRLISSASHFLVVWLRKRSSSYDGIAMRPWERQNKKLKLKTNNNKNIDAIEVRKKGDLVGNVYHGK